jgi:multidrug efflux pump subunit AcrB
MKTIIQYFINRPVVTNLITVMIIITGMAAIISLQKETFPRVEFDVIIATTSYPGSSSEDVEKLVTIPLERSLKAVDGIKKLNAVSAEGNSILYAEIEPDADIDEVFDDIKEAIDTVDDLPEEAKVPRIVSANNKRRSVMKIPLTGDKYSELRKTAKKLRDKLEENKNVALVDLDGYRPDEIRILINPDKLNNYELTIGEVAKAVKARNLNLSAGKIEAKSGDVIIRTISEFKDEKEIEKVVVRSNDSGSKVILSDIAEVRRQPVEGEVLQRSQGQEAIFLEVHIKEKADIIDSANQIRETVNTFFKGYYNKSIKSSFVDDTSFYVKRRLNVLKNNGLFGLALVFVCLLCFLNFSTSVVTSLGAPLSFMVSFVMMQYLGVSINLISMFALILVLGMLVDDSIIVAEHYYQKLEAGVPPKKAALDAALETIRPVTATILTTMVAFGALFFMGGIMGKFLWSVPAVVIICLTASWLECFLILPSHLADFSRLGKKSNIKRWYEPLLKYYEKVLRYFLKFPFTVLVSFLLILGATIALAKTMKFELFPGDDVRVVFVQLKGEVGTPLEKTDAAMKKLEVITMKELKLDSEYEQIKSQVGVLRDEHGRKMGSHYASMVLYLTDPTLRERSTGEIIKAITNKTKSVVPNFKLTITELKGGPPRGKPVEIELTSDSLEELKIVSKKVEKLLASAEGVVTSEIDFEDGKKQIAVQVNEAEAMRLGLTVEQVAFELRRALAGDEITEIRESDEDVEIKILFDDESRSKIDSLNKIYILNPQGRRIPLLKVAKLNEQPGAFVIRRLNRKRIFSVSGTLDKSITTPVKISQTLKPKMKELLKDNPDIDFSFGGENKDTQESMRELFKSFGIALMCIFLILVIMFGSLGQPGVVMSAIPLGMIGVVIAFYLKGIPLGFMAMMGVVGLVGVVVNDSIVLVTFINQKRRDIDDIKEAIIQASLGRFRPVILTTFTTVAGLMPVAESKGGDPFIRPMAISFAYGLLFATFVTLIFIPCNYLFYDRVVSFFKRIWKKVRSGVNSSEGGENSTAASAQLD